MKIKWSIANVTAVGFPTMAEIEVFLLVFDFFAKFDRFFAQRATLRSGTLISFFLFVIELDLRHTTPM